MNEQAVYWIDIDQVDPNPYQPRHHFDQEALRELSESIRRFGVLQPIVVTRKEQEHESGLGVRYEIIAGERRTRASKLAGLTKIPAIVRESEESAQEKLELAILENLQREDLNPVDKARSFSQLVEEFNLTHAEVASRLGKSREYVSNSMRILALPEPALDALNQGKISEGHTRPLLMLKDNPEEQLTLLSEIVNRGITVREAEKVARGIAKDKVRKNKELDPEMKEIKTQLEERLGTRVTIDKRQQGGTVSFDFFSRDDLRKLLNLVSQTGSVSAAAAVIQEAQARAADAQAAEGGHAQTPDLYEQNFTDETVEKADNSKQRNMTQAEAYHDLNQGGEDPHGREAATEPESTPENKQTAFSTEPIQPEQSQQYQPPRLQTGDRGGTQRAQEPVSSQPKESAPDFVPQEYKLDPVNDTTGQSSDASPSESDIQAEMDRLASMTFEFKTPDQEAQESEKNDAEPRPHFQEVKHQPDTSWSFKNNDDEIKLKDESFGSGFQKTETATDFTDGITNAPEPEPEPVSQAEMVSNSSDFTNFVAEAKKEQPVSKADSISVGDEFMTASEKRDNEEENKKRQSDSDFIVGGSDFTI